MHDIINKLPIFIQSHPFLIIALVACFTLFLITSFSHLFSKIKTISNNDATILINKQDAIVIDIRKPEEFNVGHITNSRNVIISDLKQYITSKLTNHKNHPIIIVCTKGLDANNAAKILSQEGFNLLYILKEGIHGWLTDSLPLIKK